MESITITPTWRAILPVLLEVYQNADSPQGKQAAWGELVRMAEAADKYVDYTREQAVNILRPEGEDD